MFTGIVKDIGIIESVEVRNNSLQLGISTKFDLKHLELGASVACNGCCLTVVNLVKNIFYVDIGPETLALTRFSQLVVGNKINLEPALRVGDALGGHNVSGHIDGLFQVHAFEKSAEKINAKKISDEKTIEGKNDENFWKLSLLIPNKYSKFMILKGSVAVLGISLTISHIYSLPNDFVCVEFMIIPHTYYNTILQFISAKISWVEVEFDQSTKTIASLFEGMIFNYTQMIK